MIREYRKGNPRKNRATGIPKLISFAYIQPRNCIAFTTLSIATI